MIIEVDGGQHNEIECGKADMQRTDWLEKQGYKVLRFWNHEVMTDITAVREMIWNTLADYPHPNPPPGVPGGGNNVFHNPPPGREREQDVIEVKVIENYKLELTFEDGKKGQVDIAKLVPFEGIFAPLKDKKFFSRVSVNADIGTICWENGADISPAFLYENLESL